MKNRFFLICIISILSFTGYKEIKYLNDSSTKIIQELEILEKEISNENLDYAQVKKVEVLWIKNEKVYDILLEKDIYKDIGRSISRIKLYYELDEYTRILEESASIKSYLEVIKRDTKISIENIL